jgi:predicted Abi (CAAX) family protease
MVVLVTLVILGGHLGARYIAEPGAIPQPWRVVVASIAAAVILMAVSTLTQLTSILMFSVSLPSAKQFLSTIGNFSVIGAVLGTALGFRMGLHLFVENGRDPKRYGFPELLSTISDAITVMTLIAVSLCWPFMYPLLKELVREASKPEKLWRMAPVLNFVLLFGGNYIGVQAAIFAFQLFTR